MSFIATLASGSTGNAAILSDGRTNILIDAGISCRRIVQGLKNFDLTLGDIDGILITHEHSDHVKGLETLLKNHPCPLYLTDGTAWAMEYKYPSVTDGELRIIRPGEGFMLGDVGVTPIATPHDAAESVGFLLDVGNRRALYATDMGQVTPDIAAAANCAECVFVESNHDILALLRGSYPEMLKQRILSPRGHLSNDDCADLVRDAAKRGARRFTLCHLSKENNTPAMAAATSRSALEAVGAEGVSLCVAPELGGCEPYIFGC